MQKQQQQNDGIAVMEQDDDVVHAPAKTYYTTGHNSGNAINRIRSLSVKYSICCQVINLYLIFIL